MKLADDMTSCGMIYKPSSTTMDSGIQIILRVKEELLERKVAAPV
jgi:hypothetical protein